MGFFPSVGVKDCPLWHLGRKAMSVEWSVHDQTKEIRSVLVQTLPNCEEGGCNFFEDSSNEPSHQEVEMPAVIMAYTTWLQRRYYKLTSELKITREECN